MGQSKTILKHVHKLKRVKYTNGERLFFCIKGACEYELNVKKALGKPNECHRCGKEFNLNELSVRLAKPHCNACTKGQKKEPVEPYGTDTPSPRTITDVTEDLRSQLMASIQGTLSKSLPDDDSDLL